jgi:hypothetical protein
VAELDKKVKSSDSEPAREHYVRYRYVYKIIMVAETLRSQLI